MILYPPTIEGQRTALLAAATADATLTTGEFQTICSRAGRIHGPALLRLATGLRVITDATLTEVIGEIWSVAEFPEQSLGRRDWCRLFRAAGLTVDGRAADLPAEPVRLWRGCMPGRHRGMSWTSDRAVAERFAEGNLLGRFAGQVYGVLAPPHAVLCVDNGRGEAERVLDTRGLRIAPAPPAES
jgi:hypothetical protein